MLIHWSSILRTCGLLGSAIQRPRPSGIYQRFYTTACVATRPILWRKGALYVQVQVLRKLQPRRGGQYLGTFSRAKTTTAGTALIPSLRERPSVRCKDWVTRQTKCGPIASRRLLFFQTPKQNFCTFRSHRWESVKRYFGSSSRHGPTRISTHWRSLNTQSSSGARERRRIGHVLSLRRQLRPPDRQVTTADRINRRARTVFVSAASWKRSHNKPGNNNGLDEICLSWIQRFVPIHTGSTEQSPSYALPTSLIQELLNGEKIHLMLSWERVAIGLPLPKRRLVWQEVMLWALQHQIGKAITFLDATLSDSTMPALRHAVEDSLKHIVSVSLQGPTPDLETKNNMHRLLCVFAEASMLRNDCTYSISQKIVYMVVRHSDNHQVRVLYDVLLNTRLDIHPHSLTHFMNRFTRMGRPDLAMHVLRRIAVSGADVSYETVQYSCMALLRTRWNEIEWYKIQSYLVTEMLELGIRPGIHMLNAMILNAVEAGDYQTAQAMFETARIHRIRRNTITYSILLKGAVHNSDDALIERIMHMAEEDGALPKNNELVFSLVLALLQIARENDTNILTSATRYRAILRVYTRYCDISPLQQLGIHVDMDEKSEKAGIVSSPSPKVLSIMMAAYIRFIGNSDLVRLLYNRYQELVAQNHDLIAPTAATVHLANAFLFSLGRHSATFKLCPIILRNMLEPPATTTVKVAQPTVRTWSIAARAYFFHGKRTAGEKIIEMMRERGIPPNLVTWNTILSGLASLQDAFGVVKAMKGMEAAGFESDSETLKALARIRDRNQLLDALRKVAANGDNGRSQAAPSCQPIQSFHEVSSHKRNENIQYQTTAANIELLAAPN